MARGTKKRSSAATKVFKPVRKFCSRIGSSGSYTTATASTGINPAAPGKNKRAAASVR